MSDTFHTKDLSQSSFLITGGAGFIGIVCAEGSQAMGSTLASLRAIVHALRGWPTPFGATLNSTLRPFGDAGQVSDAKSVQACNTVAEEVVGFARMRLARH